MLRFNPHSSWPVQKQKDNHSQLQNNMQFYGGVLESTGGALGWEKCTAYILLYEWINGVKKMVNTKDTHTPLHIWQTHMKPFVC